MCALAAVRDQEVFAANIAAGAAGGSAPFAAPEKGSALAKTGAPTASSFEVVAADAGSAVSFITTVEIRFDLNLSRLDPIRIEQGGTRKEEARYLLSLDRYVFVTFASFCLIRALPGQMLGSR